ncbi:MAG: hypothetical protein ACO32T_06560, partial [Candidatus Nanopelagicaceae bacterium]
SPQSVVDLAKEAVSRACGDALEFPEVKQSQENLEMSPVLADIVGETANEAVETANEVVPLEENNKAKRRTKVGFERKVQEWTKALDNMTEETYQSVIAEVDDDYKYWTSGGKFESSEIEEKLKDVTAHWTSAVQVAEPEIIEDKKEYFLEQLNSNLSETGLGDLQDEIKNYYGSGNIPQDLLDATVAAWDIINDSEDEIEVYDGYVPEEEELEEITTEAKEDKTEENNKTWQNSILNNCETVEELSQWDRFIANAITREEPTILPETLTALETTRARLKARDEEQRKESLIAGWLSRANSVSNINEVQTIYDEIKESAIVPTMALVNALDKAKKDIEAKVTEVDDNDWGDVESGISDEVTATTTASQQGFSSIGTSDAFGFLTLEGQVEKHRRFDVRYILNPGTKLYQPSTKYVFEVITWEELKKLSPLTEEDVNKLPLKSLHSPTRSYAKAEDKTSALVIVSDSQADNFVVQYRARIDQIVNDPNFEIGN